MYAERTARGSGFATITVGLQNESGTWVPLTKVDSQEIGILDADRFADWAKSKVVFRRGPITEFEKELVFEISYTGVQKAPRRKCGLELETVHLKRVAWDVRASDVIAIESFRQQCDV